MRGIVQYLVKLDGKTALFIHQDDVTKADEVEDWRIDNPNTKRGDDRCPSWTWLTYLYENNGMLVIPQINIMALFRDSGQKIPMKAVDETCKTTASLKSETQSQLVIEGDAVLKVNGKALKYKTLQDIAMLEGNSSSESLGSARKDKQAASRRARGAFALQCKAAQEVGIRLDVRRATIGQAKHVRVRPVCDVWSCEFPVIATGDIFTKQDNFERLLQMAGRFIGIGDWRPGSPKKPGPYGQFEPTVKVVKERF